LAIAASVDGSPAAAGNNWIVDERSGCATSHPAPTSGDSIRWYGTCRDGKLHGLGTLIWYRDGVETGRNEGGFRDGLLHGDAITTLPDGHVLVGRYEAGRRLGKFVAILPDGSHILASYADGVLQSQRGLSEAEIAAWYGQPASGAAVGPPANAAAAAGPMAKPLALTKTPAAPRPIAEPQLPPPAPSPIAPRNATSPEVPTPPLPATPAPLLTQWAAPAAVGSRAGATSEPGGARPTLWSAAAAMAPQPSTETVPASDRPPLIGSGRADAMPASRADAVDPVASPAAVAAVRQRLAPTLMARLYTGDSASGTLPPRPTPDPSAGSATADGLFAQGYRLEGAGRLDEATRLYDRVLLDYPSAPSAMLANARLEALRQRGAQAPVRRLEPATGPTIGPVRAANGSGFAAPGAVGRSVCSRDGLYEGGARWCGTVTRDDGDHIEAEVRRVEVPGFAAIGIGRSVCTGDTLVTWFSRGKTLRVPKDCLSFEG
jgi:hypothetical protein